ncbi:MAG: hypothetical protein PVF33_13605 [Candidatus Latescibacterota bacterium]|jgi:hypothetical protein
MIVKAFVIWIALVVLAVLNGIARNSLIEPRLGDQPAHIISTVILCAVIAAVAWISNPWLSPSTVKAAFGVGVLWFSLTIAFEFLAGHYLFGHTWQELFADYNLAHGRVWVFVLLVTMLAPAWAERVRAVKSFLP